MAQFVDEERASGRTFCDDADYDDDGDEWRADPELRALEEEERQLNYSFDTTTNDRQNVNAQEATFTKESPNINQQQEENEPSETELEHTDISEEKKIESIKEDEFQKNDKPSEEIKSDPGNREEEAPKKGFWSRFFGS